MRLTYDPVADMAYLYVVDHIGEGEVTDSIPLDDDELPGDLVLDLDADGRLLGIEIFRPRDLLRSSLLEQAEPPGT